MEIPYIYIHMPCAQIGESKLILDIHMFVLLVLSPTSNGLQWGSLQLQPLTQIPGVSNLPLGNHQSDLQKAYIELESFRPRVLHQLLSHFRCHVNEPGVLCFSIGWAESVGSS